VPVLCTGRCYVPYQTSGVATGPEVNGAAADHSAKASRSNSWPW